mmetsp:Transcript_36286/g.63947  ORF Transcript_36286/g.63947 Transcript_36286/m.63947 type:complete len:307 (-) Transcript_36286:72-992(-)
MSALEKAIESVQDSLVKSKFEGNEKAAVEEALAVAKAAPASDAESTALALNKAVSPIMYQVKKRAGAITGRMVQGKDGSTFFEPHQKPTKARLLLEESTGVAFIDLDECADDNSLACIIDDLKARTLRGRDFNTIVMNIEASAKHPALHRYLIRSGTFSVGLRAIGIPIVGIVSGRVAGPAWSLLMTADYRISTSTTKFHLPICSAPECLHELVGPAVATELCLSSTTLMGDDLLELGCLHQVRPTLDECKMAAYEFAKRISGFPRLACRQTMRLLCPKAQDFVNAVAADPSIAMQVYPEDVAIEE